MDNTTDQQHATLLAASSKYANKVSPLLIACGLIQEGLNLNQALTDHAKNLKNELDAIKAGKAPDENNPAVRDGARQPAA